MVNLSPLVYAATALLSFADATPLIARTPTHHNTSPKAVFFQTNKSPNSIVALPVVDEDGKLGDAVFHPAGGNGAAEVSASGGVNTPDSLGSQDSVVVEGNHLFAVNAGSNQVSLFSIPPFDPTNLSLIGTYTTPGDFPVSLAVRHDLLCVGHAGPRAGVSCARWSPRGIDAFDTLRAVDLDQTNPPSAARNLLSETYFADDGKGPVVVANVRGISSSGGSSSNNTSFLATWPVDQQKPVVSYKPTLISPSGTASLFGAAPIPHSSLVFIADPTFGGVTIDLSHPEKPITKIAVPGQKAICWARVSINSTPNQTIGTAILPDARKNRIAEVDILSGTILQDWTSSNGNAGNFDFALAAGRMYALAFGQNSTDTTARVAVFDVSSSSASFADVHNVAVDGTDGFAMGLAVYPSIYP